MTWIKGLKIVKKITGQNTSWKVVWAILSVILKSLA